MPDERTVSASTPIEGPGGAPAAEGAAEPDRLRARLREAEERFRILALAMPQIVCVISPDGTPEYVNDAWIAFSGADLAASAREGWGRFVHPDDLGAARDCLRRALRSLTPQQLELRYRAADGTHRWFLSRLAPVVEGGRVIRLVGAGIDIEERKRAEEALRAREADAVRRAAEIQEVLDALRRAEHELRAADRRKTEFLAVLSHELRNPLAPIRNSLHVLERAPAGSEPWTRGREIIRRQTDHLARLVDDLLDVTRVARGKIVLQRTRTDLRDVVRAAVDDVASVFERADVALRVHARTPGPVWIDADATRIAQVIGNLLHNSVKFTPPGGAVTVSVGATGGDAELSVRDTGVGMEPATVQAMFEPFAQADQPLARTAGGLGLGLALVKALVELHGGTVEAQSEGFGRGAEFLVRLPLAAGGAREDARRADEAGAPPRLVVVIEDNLDAGDSLVDLLQLHGHRVRVARDGRSGLDLVRALRPDVVLCDLGLPDVDGYEVARQLRRDAELWRTRLVAVSGYAQPDDRQRARDAGFDAHVAKPPVLGELLSALATVG